MRAFSLPHPLLLFCASLAPTPSPRWCRGKRPGELTRGPRSLLHAVANEAAVTIEHIVAPVAGHVRALFHEEAACVDAVIPLPSGPADGVFSHPVVPSLPFFLAD